jgi:hypothetical protein
MRGGGVVIEKLLQVEPTQRRPAGALATIGLLTDYPEWEDAIAQVLEERATRMDHPVALDEVALLDRTPEQG